MVSSPYHPRWAIPAGRRMHREYFGMTAAGDVVRIVDISGLCKGAGGGVSAQGEKGGSGHIEISGGDIDKLFRVFVEGFEDPVQAGARCGCAVERTVMPHGDAAVQAAGQSERTIGSGWEKKAQTPRLAPPRDIWLGRDLGIRRRPSSISTVPRYSSGSI